MTQLKLYKTPDLPPCFFSTRNLFLYYVLHRAKVKKNGEILYETCCQKQQGDCYKRPSQRASQSKTMRPLFAPFSCNHLRTPNTVILVT